jgi:hypothetical protein
VSTDIEAVRTAARLLNHFEELWRARLDQFASVLDDTPEGGAA